MHVAPSQPLTTQLVQVRPRPPAPTLYDTFGPDVLSIALSFIEVRELAVVCTRVRKSWNDAAPVARTRQWSYIQKQYPNLLPQQIFMDIPITIDVAMLIVTRPQLNLDMVLQVESGYQTMLEHVCDFPRDPEMLQLARLLIQKGASVDGGLNTTYKPLHYAVHYENLPLVQLLIENGADMYIGDVWGKTPFTFLDIKPSDLLERPNRSQRDAIFQLYINNPPPPPPGACCTIL